MTPTPSLLRLIAELAAEIRGSLPAALYAELGVSVQDDADAIHAALSSRLTDTGALLAKLDGTAAEFKVESGQAALRGDKERSAYYWDKHTALMDFATTLRSEGK